MIGGGGNSGNLVQQPQQQQYQPFMTQQQPQPNMYNPYATSMPQQPQPQQFIQSVQQQPQMWGAIQQQQTSQMSQVAFQQPQPIVQPQQIVADRTAPIMNPNTGAPDYSLQWAAYYRSIGLVEQAAMVENRLKLNTQPAQLPTNSIPQQQQPTGFTQNQAQ